ncbi:MAG: tetratricopeptide repeat protein [Chloroflexi bacterium]|nr:tetratricopeptide repeat protein [Chloroflexota bacterium]
MSKYDFWDELGRIFNAVVAYQEKTVEFNDRFITPWIKMGNVFDKQDRNREAVSAFQNAIALDPANARNWQELGNLYFQMNDFENAAEAYQRSTELAPDSGWAFSNLAHTLVSQGKYEESIPLYQKGIGLLQDDKDKAVAWNRLGNAYRKLNNYALAMDAFTQADKLDSENAGFRDVLDDVSDGPVVIEAAEAEGQEGNGLVAEIFHLSVDAESEPAAEPQVNANQVVVMENEPASGLKLEVDSQSSTDSATEEVAVPELQVEAVAEEDLDAEAVLEEQTEAPVSESVNEQQPSVQIEAEKIEEAVAAPRSVLEIVEAVIAKVLAESEDETPVEVKSEPETVAEQPVVTGEVETAEQELSAPVEIENVASEPAPEVEMELVDEPVAAEASDAPAAETIEVDQDEALHLIARNTSETFTDTLFVAGTESDTADAASLPVKETHDELGSEVKVEDVSVELPEAELAAPPDEQETPANEAYEEYLNDSHGQFRISTAENDSAQDSFLPAELLAKIDLAGDMQIEADAKNAHVWNELGNVYFNSGAYEDAIIAYSKSIELDRQFAWPYSNLALVYVQKGRYAEAMLLYQRSIELFSNDKDKAISWNRLGNVYRRQNDYDNAISAYQRADELDTDNATLSQQSRFSLLGNYYMESKTSYAS